MKNERPCGDFFKNTENYGRFHMNFTAIKIQQITEGVIFHIDCCVL